MESASLILGIIAVIGLFFLLRWLIPYRRPDILLESFDGKQLWVEIWVSHETEEDKRKDGRRDTKTANRCPREVKIGVKTPKRQNGVRTAKG